ncbi:MAG: helix-turn-helix domain-containing protein [Candidatus Woesearchaeota archaeon]
MIVQKDFLSKLKDFGLNTYESKLWTALLSRGISTAGELSDIANVPRSRSYDVLESLEKKGFIIMKLGKPIKYIAVPPEEVLERVKKKVINDADYKTKTLESLEGSEILTELTLLHTQGVDLVEPTDLSGALKGRNNLYNHIESMIKSAEESVDLMTTSEGLIRKAEALKALFQKAKERKIKIRIAAPLTKETDKIVKELKGFVEIRDAKEIKARFCIIDGKQITFMLMDDSEVHPTYDSGVWVNTPFFASALKQMFESEWEKMSPLEVKH